MRPHGIVVAVKGAKAVQEIEESHKAFGLIGVRYVRDAGNADGQAGPAGENNPYAAALSQARWRAVAGYRWGCRGSSIKAEWREPLVIDAVNHKGTRAEAARAHSENRATQSSCAGTYHCMPQEW